MAYDTTSTHPLAALVRTAGQGDVPPDVVAEQLERVHYASSADISALKLPNTLQVHVADNDAGIDIYAYDADATGTATGIITDLDGRKFVITETTLTQAEYDALSVKHPKTHYSIKEA